MEGNNGERAKATWGLRDQDGQHCARAEESSQAQGREVVCRHVERVTGAACGYVADVESQSKEKAIDVNGLAGTKRLNTARGLAI